jgi:hypothetical protein
MNNNESVLPRETSANASIWLWTTFVKIEHIEKATGIPHRTRIRTTSLNLMIKSKIITFLILSDISRTRLY